MLTETRTENTNANSKNKTFEKIKITSRDLEIIRFCLEMRFATFEQIYNRFFKNTYSGEVSQCDRWAKGRIYQLRQSGYLSQQKNHQTGQNLILPTLKGYILVKNLLYFEDLPRPLNHIDYRQFEHDKLLSDIRMYLEGASLIKRWVSERSLQAKPELIAAFGSESIADSLCIDNDGTAYFFELELSLKTKDRIKKKIRRYVHLLRSEKEIYPGLKSIHFVCAKASIFNAITNETKMYGTLFKVQMLNDFLKQNIEVANVISK